MSQQAVRKRRGMVTWNILSVAFVGTIGGFLAGISLTQAELNVPTAVLIFMLQTAGLWGAAVFAGRKMDRLEKERIAMRRGADGEASVALSLADFPDEFYVINDLKTPCGNIDHVVVGPTGVFLLDTKNWRGVITADGNDELLCNGKPTEKPIIRPFVGRLMRVKEQVKALSRIETYFKGLLAFPSARVDARWGTTGNMNCLCDGQLYYYIVEAKARQKLSKKEVDQLAQAFLALARMDNEFESSSNSSTAEERTRGQAEAVF